MGIMEGGNLLRNHWRLESSQESLKFGIFSGIIRVNNRQEEKEIHPIVYCLRTVPVNLTKGSNHAWIWIHSKISFTRIYMWPTLWGESNYWCFGWNRPLSSTVPRKYISRVLDKKKWVRTSEEMKPDRVKKADQQFKLICTWSSIGNCQKPWVIDFHIWLSWWFIQLFNLGN